MEEAIGSVLIESLREYGPIGILSAILFLIYWKREKVIQEKDEQLKTLGEKIDSVHEETIRYLLKSKEESDKRAEEWAREFRDVLRNFREP
jgi:hypothetical protein